MENSSDLKSLNVTKLNIEELKKTDGGSIEWLILHTIEGAVAVDQFMQGVVDGFKENNYKPE